MTKMEEEKANEAIASLSDRDVSNADRAAVEARFGPRTARVVDEVYGVAMQPPESWGEASTSMETGLDAMHARLRERYPWLGDAAHGKFDAMFLMTWR